MSTSSEDFSSIEQYDTPETLLTSKACKLTNSENADKKFTPQLSAKNKLEEDACLSARADSDLFRLDGEVNS